MVKSKRVISVFTLVMINVIAVDSLRTLPLTAKLGFSLVFYYSLAALGFFIPLALVSAELATAYPEAGGIYIWVREAFGRKAAFITVWLQWIYNIVWFPTILAFIAATLAFFISPALANHPKYLWVATLGLFWLFTLLNCFGMKISGLVSTIGATVGTILPMLGIIALGVTWVLLGKPLSVSIDSKSWLPDFSSLGNLSLFSVVLFGLLGIEMSAVHAEEVKNPQRDYPKALFYSTLIILTTLVFGSLAIVVVVPQEKMSVVSGLMDAYNIFFKAYKLPWMVSITAACIIIGGLSGVAAWILGPAKGLLVAARDNCIPPFFARVNRYGAPINLLIAQGLIFSVLSTTFIFFETINAAYWILSDLCAQMALMVYIFMFTAALRLRYKKPYQRGAFTIPGGNWLIWILCLLGIFCCTAAIMIGFIPPSQINIGSKWVFESFLIGGLVLFVAIPWLFIRKKNLSYSKA